ncbi:18524_t:CDS:2 [Gigaspora margarita]|uniref:18524_t:CDS:1 n=1 Tax=Gigaspora margarita TaxID=4874 RepID=A0ABM8VYI6_GIGMA|nr:18524_t:CDS:2 [Gigaspora margarita]
MASELFSSIYADYLSPFARHVNATVLRIDKLAPYFKGASVNTILFMTASFYVSPRQNEPPLVPYWIPFIGSAITMGIDPIKFYRDRQKEGNNLVFNAKLADASAEEAYRSLTVPVFGKGVVYDVHNSVLMEQKKFVKAGLSVENLRAYIPMIEMETKNYLSRWNKKSDVQDIHKAMAELIILTASRCLLVAQIFHDLDGGFKPINFLFDDLPLPSNRLRDKAHVKMRHFFIDIMKHRRDTGKVDSTDVMQYLATNCQYKSGRSLTDMEVAHIMIAMLMAGQHTSSTTSAWAFLYLAWNPELFDKLRQEQIEILGSLDAPLTYDSLKQLTLHNNIVRETLRLRPPILHIIRKVVRDMTIPGTTYVIPKDAYVQCIPAITARSDEFFENAEEFNPYRWKDYDLQNKEHDDDLVDYGFGALSASARSPVLPFGAGRHRCIGEPFAYVQIKTILATFVRTFNLELHNNKFPECDFTTMMVQPKHPMVKYTRVDC